MRLIECVPNFSEGRRPEVIAAIRDAVAAVPGVTVLHVDPGQATNRTVLTFAGAPEPVIEAAFRGIRTAAALIDMTQHHGEHPRMGATDVCPLIPISGVTLAEAAHYSRQLAERVGKELGIPVYLYEAAQPDPARKNLAVIRAGEYEGLARKMGEPAWAPDFGPRTFQPKSGATVIGARDFLVAFNVNLNTTSTRRANAVAFDVREQGRPRRDGDPVTGKVVTDNAGNPVMIPGSLKAVKAIGWFIPEYGVAQVSMNLVDLGQTPLHAAFDEVCRKAESRGLRVTGSELVGLVPLKSLTDAGRYFLQKQQRSTGVGEAELIRIAILSMGLDELAPFKPEERILEYKMRAADQRPLARLSLEGFVNETASESPAPGGGSVAAAVGALGAALGTMVANLSAHKPGWDARWAGFSTWAEKGQAIKAELLDLVDDDTQAFKAVMAAMALPKSNPEELTARKAAMARANHEAVQVPYRVMRVSIQAFEVLEAMAREGNPASVSDAGVGALCARAAVRGAWLNVRINLSGGARVDGAEELLSEGARIVEEAERLEQAVLQLVNSKIK
ncbi:MAG TPA: glutamate formimidoyltransferase [Gemmatimonadales bacterium]|nr:glutamate formimidoyltransferase [Gemmatimonadales bacterium]